MAKRTTWKRYQDADEADFILSTEFKSENGQGWIRIPHGEHYLSKLRQFKDALEKVRRVVAAGDQEALLKKLAAIDRRLQPEIDRSSASA